LFRSQYDDADVRYGFVADALEDRIGRDSILDQRPVTVAAQGVQARENVGDLLLYFLEADDSAGHRSVTAFETVGNHQNAVTPCALGGLDDEITAPADDLFELLDLLFRLDDPVHLRDVNAGLDGPFLGDDLVIDNRVQTALVVLQHVVRIAPIDAHDAFVVQALPGSP